jgi:Flp pilus assembly protein TadD
MPTKPLDYSDHLPDGTHALSLTDYGLAAATAVIAFTVYFFTVAPTVTGEDSGELIAAAYSLGIPHPSGYPLWCLLGNLFITILPWGTVAWRVNLMSAFFAALTAGLLCLLLIKLLGRAGTKSVRDVRAPAVAGALAVAFSREFWEQSLIAEVYTLNAFFVALSVLLLVGWHERRQNRYLYALAAVVGLGLTNHGAMMVIGVILLAFLLIADPPRRAHLPRYLIMTLLFGCALLVYLYLPIRSRANPPVDWGNPETWRAFWAHVNREQYQHLFHQEPRSIGKFLAQISTFSGLFWREFSPWILWLAVPGVVLLLRRVRWAALLLLAIFFGIAFAFMLVPNYPLDHENIWVINVFWIPSYMMAGLFIGAGVAWLAPRFHSPVLAGVLVVVVVGLPLATHVQVNNRRNYVLAEDFGRNILRTLAPNAIYFAGSDYARFPVLYLQVVEGERPDVLLANPYGYPRPEVYRGMPAALKATIASPIPTSEDVAMIERWVVANTSRPVYFSTMRAFPEAPQKHVVPAGLLFRVLPRSQKEDTRNYFDEYRWQSLDVADVRGDFSGLWMLYDYHTALGRAALANGAFHQGLRSYEYALALLPENKQAFNNAGTDFVHAGLYELAIAQYHQALQLDPRFELALRNLGLVYLYTNQNDKALRVFQYLRALNPNDAQAIHGEALALLASGAVDAGLELLEAAAARQPDNPQILEELGTALWEIRGDAGAAAALLSEVVARDPRNKQAAALLRRIGEERAAPNPPQADSAPD